MPPKDPDHHRRLKREHAARKYEETANRRRRRELNALAKQARAGWNRRIKARIGCAVCGEARPDRLDWHHMDPEAKRANISELVADRVAVGRIMMEIMSCVCLCSGCHDEVERRGIVVLQGRLNGKHGLTRARQQLQAELDLAESFILKAHPQMCFAGDLNTIHRFFRDLMRVVRRKKGD